jgi:hypothetical protein
MSLGLKLSAIPETMVRTSIPVSIFKIKSLFSAFFFGFQDVPLYEYPFWQNPQIEWLLLWFSFFRHY